MSIEIIQATIERLDDISLLFDRYRVFYRQPSDLSSAKEFIQQRLLNEDAVILMAIEKDLAVGYTQLFPSWSSVSMQRVWILNDLYVLPEARNRGIARALMSAARDLAISTNAVRLLLATEATNTIGQKLYESMGYRQLDEFYHYVLVL